MVLKYILSIFLTMSFLIISEYNTPTQLALEQVAGALLNKDIFAVFVGHKSQTIPM